MQKNTLDSFLKAGIKERSLSPPRAPKICKLGIIGTRKDLTINDINEIMNLIVEDLDNIQSINVPAEGESSIYIEMYAEDSERKIPCTLYEADWRRDGKRASIFRNNKLIRESTHFLIFGAPRSVKPLQLAEQLVKKKHVVYYMPHNSMELQQLEGEIGCAS